MKRGITAGGVLLVLAVFVLSACGGVQPVASHSPAASATPTAIAAPAGVMVLVVANPDSFRQLTIKLVDFKGHVRATTSFAAPASPVMGGCAAVLSPAVRVAAGAAYYADSAGVIRRLDVNGAMTKVATFALAAQQLLSYAVSPDGRKLIAIVLSTPALKHPTPPSPYDPFVAGSHWFLDLETAVAGGTTSEVMHKDLGAQPATGPTTIAGWDDAGPTATLNSWTCVQNPLSSIGYPGAPLIHLGLDGSHLDQIGGAGCTPRDEIHDGTVLCSGAGSFTVRARDGKVLWSRHTGGDLVEPRLSADGTGVTTNGNPPALYLRDFSQVASMGRTSYQNGPTEGFLGWVNSTYVVVVKLDQGGRLGLIPVVNPTNFIDLGYSVGQVIFDAFPSGLTLAGTIGV